MNRTIPAAVALLVLVATAGTAAALPGQAEERASDPGPPGGLPDVVPDFVSNILDAVGDFVAGVLDAVLGDVVSETAGAPGG